MGDLASTSFSSSCSCPLIRLQPQLAVKHNIAHFMPSQKSFHGSYTRHLDFARTSARPRWHLEQVAAINLIALGVATGEFQVGCEEEEMAEGLLLQPASDGNEETEEAQQASDTETSLVLATHAIMGTLAGVNYASEVPGQVRGDATDTPAASSQIIVQAQKERMMKRKTQQLTYLFAALASSVGITSLAGASVYCRFAWQMQGGGDVPWTEMCGTFSLALGAAVGMEYWARWAHRVLWHASLWSMHESHHQPRDGPFELNDVFAIINAVPAIALMAFGFLNKGLVPGLCFGAGLGITMFGIAYMFVHDGLVHRRFPVGPIADVPYFQKVAAAHQLHHADKFNGVPYGLFLGPMELEEVGGRIELEKVLQKRKRENRNPIIG